MRKDNNVDDLDKDLDGPLMLECESNKLTKDSTIGSRMNSFAKACTSMNGSTAETFASAVKNSIDRSILSFDVVSKAEEE